MPSIFLQHPSQCSHQRFFLSFFFLEDCGRLSKISWTLGLSYSGLTSSAGIGNLTGLCAHETGQYLVVSIFRVVLLSESCNIASIRRKSNRLVVGQWLRKFLGFLLSNIRIGRCGFWVSSNWSLTVVQAVSVQWKNKLFFIRTQL